MITIVDYKMGNLLSIQNMLKKIGVKSQITSDPLLIANATKLILPGVGAFDSAMNAIAELGLKEVLDDFVLVEKKPILGICLGMQLMCKYSEEGKTNGLNWIDAEVKRFPKTIEDKKLMIPHIGWSEVSGSDMMLREKIENKFYFVHSYYVKLNDDKNLLFTSKYGVEFCSAFKKENIIGVQFHPEKSHKFGMHFLNKFALNS
jgi:glutamine amidotransferase